MVALSFGTLISTAAAICHEPPSVKGTASSYGPMQFGRLLAKESSIDLESVMPSSTAKPAQPEVRDEPKLKQRSRQDRRSRSSPVIAPTREIPARRGQHSTECCSPQRRATSTTPPSRSLALVVWHGARCRDLGNIANLICCFGNQGVDPPCTGTQTIGTQLNDKRLGAHRRDHDVGIAR